MPQIGENLNRVNRKTVLTSHSLLDFNEGNQPIDTAGMTQETPTIRGIKC